MSETAQGGLELGAKEAEATMTPEEDAQKGKAKTGRGMRGRDRTG